MALSESELVRSRAALDQAWMALSGGMDLMWEMLQISEPTELRPDQVEILFRVLTVAYAELFHRRATRAKDGAG